MDEHVFPNDRTLLWVNLAGVHTISTQSQAKVRGVPIKMHKGSVYSGLKTMAGLL